MTKKSSPKRFKIATINELKNGQSKKFIVFRKKRETEAFLIKRDERHYAYLNLCRHWTVGLDFDDNEIFSEDQEWLVCKNHGAIYHPETGECASGPCNGAALYRVPVVEENGDVWALLEKIDWGDYQS